MRQWSIRDISAGALHVEGGSGGVTLLHVGEGVLVLKKQQLVTAQTVSVVCFWYLSPGMLWART